MVTKNDLSNLTPCAPISPGSILQSELEERNIDTTDFAKAICITQKQLCEILNGDRPINATIASALERELGIPASSWLRLQDAYELDLLRLQHSPKHPTPTPPITRNDIPWNTPTLTTNL